MSVVAIEGLIGAGKSTVMKCLQDLNPRFRCEPEPLEAWTLLDQFYANQNNEAFAFEAQVLCSYAHKKFKAGPDDHVVFTERSALSAVGVFVPLLRRNGALIEREVDELNRLQMNLGLHQPNTVVYLDLDIDTCLERLAWRNRGTERSAVTRPYLEALKTAYNDYFLAIDNTVRVERIEVDPSHGPETVARQICDVIVPRAF